MAEVAKLDEKSAVNATEEEKKVEVGEEQANNCEETFLEPVEPAFKFRCEWTLWEHYDAFEGQTDYQNALCKVCWFNDIISFSVAWNTIPHRQLSNIFYNDQTKSVKL